MNVDKADNHGTITERVLLSLYNNTENVEATVNTVFAMLRDHYDLGSIYIFEDSEDGKYCQNTFGWCAAGKKKSLECYHYSFENGINQHYSSFDRDGVFHCRDKSLLSDAQKRFFEEWGAMISLQCGFADKGRMRGFVCYNEYQDAREWKDEEISTLVTISRLIGSYLIKSRNDDFSADFKAALDNSASFVYLIDTDTYKVLYSNYAIRDHFGLDYRGGVCYNAFLNLNEPCENCPVREYYETGKPQAIEVLRPDGMWVLAQASPIRWQGRDVMMITCTDITKHKQASEELRIRSEEYGIVVNQSGKNMLRYDIKKRQAHNYGETSTMFDIPEIMCDFPESLIEKKVILPESVEDFYKFFAAMHKGEQNGSSDTRMRLASGDERWFRSDYTLITDAHGEPSYAVISFYDNTELRDKELAYLKWRNDLSALIAQSVSYMEANLTKDVVERVEGYKENYLHEQKSGYSMEWLLKSECERNVCPEDKRGFSKFHDRKRLLAQYALGNFQEEFEFRSSVTGVLKWYRSKIQMTRYPYSEDIKIIVAIICTDKEHREKERLEQLAYRDSMTQLLNRDATEEKIRDILFNADKNDYSAMFMVDIDNFKEINELKGHEAGDKALRDIAGLILQLFNHNEIVGRIGGDEFAVFIPKGASDEMAAAKAEALIEALQLSVGELALTASVGVAFCRGNEKSFSQLYVEADRALYNAQRRGNGQYCISKMTAKNKKALLMDSAASVQFKALLENIDGGIILADAGEEIKIKYVSSSFYKSLNKNEEEAGSNGEDLLSLVYPADLQTVKEAMRRAACGEVTDCAYRVGAEGKIWHQIRLAKLPDIKEKSNSVIGVITDISKLKKSELRLSFAEERYRLAMKQTKGLIWEVDIAKRTIYQSMEVSKAFGFSECVFENVPEAIIERGIIHSDTEDEFLRMFEDIYNGVEGKTYILRVAVEGNGHVWVKNSFVLMRDGSGKAYRAIGVSEKVNNIEFEMYAFMAEIRFMDLIAHSMVGVLCANISQNLIEKNTFFRNKKRTGNFDEFFNEYIEDISDDQDKRKLCIAANRENLLKSYQKGQPWMFVEYRGRTSNGETGWINMAVNMLRHPVSGDIYAFFYCRDISARRKWESEISDVAERESATLLYTKAAMQTLVNAAVAELPDNSRCAVTVLEIIGLERLKMERGVQVAQRVLFMLGRLCRIAIEGNAIVGHLDESHIFVFRAEDVSLDRQANNAERYRERIRMLLQQSLTDIDITILCGYTVAAKYEADLDEMIRRAAIACDSSRQWPGHPVTQYVNADYGLQTNEDAANGECAMRRILLLTDGSAEKLFGTDELKTLKKSYIIETANNSGAAIEQLHRETYSMMICDADMQNEQNWTMLEDMKYDEALSHTPYMVIVEENDAQSEITALNLGAVDVLCRPVDEKVLLSRIWNRISNLEHNKTAEEKRILELRLQQQANILRLAEHDELTGLLNKQAFYRRVRERIDADPDTRYMIVRWDMDNFKMLNDALGVETGDRLLRDIAQCMREACSKESIFARLEADHFVDFLPVAQSSADEIFSKVNEWFKNYKIDFKLTSRMGVYYIDDPDIDVSLMCDRAMLALRSIKGSFTNRIAYYDDKLRSKLMDEQELQGEMAPALANGQFKVYFQPQYNYDGGEMIGAEALVRWEHPKRGMLSPAIFVPLFERNGFITSLDEFVWEESCKYLKKWIKKGIPSISVNISRIDIYNTQLCEKIEALVKKYDIPASRLHLEITETAYMQNPEQLIEIVKRLRAMGFMVEMDDFGAGYSSLTTLKNVPVDVLKLDMKFLATSPNDVRGGNLLSSVIRMAHWLKLPVIAEGVETKTQADYLKSLNCFYMQGYYFGRPMPADQFETVLEKSRFEAAEMYEDVNIEGMAAFWDASAQTALLFNSFVGGECIVEYSGGNVEIVRANEAFFNELGTTRKIYADRVTHAIDDLDKENRETFISMLEDAIKTGGESECEVMERMQYCDNMAQWTHNRARVLAQNKGSYLLYIATENITARKKMEENEKRQAKELRENLRLVRAEEEKNHLVIQYLKALLFNYDYDNDVLFYQVNQAEKGLVTRRIEHYLEYLPGSVVVHPDHIGAYRRVYSEAAKAPKKGTFEYVADNFGTGYRWCCGHYTSVADEKGHVYRMVGIVYDIQEEKE